MSYQKYSHKRKNVFFSIVYIKFSVNWGLLLNISPFLDIIGWQLKPLRKFFSKHGNLCCTYRHHTLTQSLFLG